MNVFASYLRTLVPIVAGLVLGLAAKVGLDIDDATVTTIVTAGLTVAYYAVVRGVEALTERIGGPSWLQTIAGALLGYVRPPQYEKPTTVPLTVSLHYDPGTFAQDVADIVRRYGGRAS